MPQNNERGPSPREDTMLHQVIETLNARVALRPRYDNFIGGKWVPPVKGEYFDNISPITGKPVCEIARSHADDIELALDAAHAAKDAWGNAAPARRARTSSTRSPTASRRTSSCWPRSRRSTTASRSARPPGADIPLAVDHFRYFAGVHARAGRLAVARSTTTPSPITSTSRSASSARSSRGTSRS